MSKVQLSIPVALLIENLLTSGEKNDIIMDCMNNRDFTPLLEKVKDKTMNFEERLETAEEIGDEWEEAIRSGYEFKFLHINALKRLLDFRFDKIVNQDYEQDGISLRRLYLDPIEIDVLRSLIGRQWRVIEESVELNSPQIEVRIELKYRD
ncbi:hypothetical protein ACP8HI_21230 [Paenibacillus sp. FA6]|uniref:hypothetical protein n=1 Tax=Paenibacillus sp. FA6 TaxID=3413029 RepID=UPI003F656F69